ncbi:30694_t:CDS:2, partial [Racocetra persica]
LETVAFLRFMVKNKETKSKIGVSETALTQHEIRDILGNNISKCILPMDLKRYFNKDNEDDMSRWADTFFVALLSFFSENGNVADTNIHPLDALRPKIYTLLKFM